MQIWQGFCNMDGKTGNDMARHRTSVLWVFTALSALSGCEGISYSAHNALATANRQIIKVSDKYNPPAKIARPGVDSRYCYATASDVVCYQDPLSPDQNARLVGYQEPLAEDGQAPQTARLEAMQVHDLAPPVSARPVAPPKEKIRDNAPLPLITR